MDREGSARGKHTYAWFSWLWLWLLKVDLPGCSNKGLCCYFKRWGELTLEEKVSPGTSGLTSVPTHENHLQSPAPFSSVQSLSRVRLFVTPWTAARQVSLSITNSRSSLKLTCIESVMPSSHLILCCPLLLLPPIPPSIRVFSNESTLCIRWPKYWGYKEPTAQWKLNDR